MGRAARHAAAGCESSRRHAQARCPGAARSPRPARGASAAAAPARHALGGDRVEGQPVGGEAVLVIEEEARVAKDELAAARREHLAACGSRRTRAARRRRSASPRLPLQGRRDDDLALVLERPQTRASITSTSSASSARGHGDVVAMAQHGEEVGLADRAPEPLERARRDDVRRHDDRVALEGVDDALAELARVLGVARGIDAPACRRDPMT